MGSGPKWTPEQIRQELERLIPGKPAAPVQKRVGNEGFFQASGKIGIATVSRSSSGWNFVVPRGGGNESCGVPQPDDVFQRCGLQMLQALADGQSFTDEQFRDGIGSSRKGTPEELQHGRDQCYQVSPQTREAARKEYDAKASYQRAVDSHAEIEQWAGFERELFARLYGNPIRQSEPHPADQWLAQLHEQADLVKGWRELEAQCKGDAWAAGIAAQQATQRLQQAIGQTLQNAPKEDPVRLQQDADALEQIAPGAGSKLAAEAEAGEDHAALFGVSLGALDVLARQAFEVAAGRATEEIGDMQGALAALGAGNLPGVASRVNAPRDEIRKALQSNPALLRIAKIAGRLRMRARAAQKQKVHYLPEQVVDVTLGAEIARLLPSETLLLASGDTELLLHKRLAERQAFQYHLEGKEALEKGPLLLLVDNSGSMQGAPHEWAMGLALALMEVCAKQNRAFGLAHFDDRVTCSSVLTPQEVKRMPWAALVELVTHFSGGGTQFRPALLWADDQIREDFPADVVLLTDGVASDNWVPEVRKIQEQGARVFGVAIGTRASFGTGEAVLSGLARLSDLTPGKEAPIDLVLGI